MHVLVKSGTGWSSAAWLLPLALLALPNCNFERQGGVATPRNDAIFCDIEVEMGRRCAVPGEPGIRFSRGAVALANRESAVVGLDDSPEALARCGGQPEAVTFRDLFPTGTKACVNWLSEVGPSPAPFLDPQAVCLNRCERFFGHTDSEGRFIPDNPPDPAVHDFCLRHAKVSTNSGDGFAGLCAIPDEQFDMPAHPENTDPRRIPELVRWTDRVGVTASPAPFFDTLVRTAATSQPPAFDAGATSTQVITQGDAFVQFTANAPITERAVGFGQGQPSPGLSGFVFGLDVTNGGNVVLIENGQITNFLGTYVAGDRFRISIEGAGMRAYKNDVLLHTSTNTPPYPLRVEASLLEQGATVSFTRAVFIK